MTTEQLQHFMERLQELRNKAEGVAHERHAKALTAYHDDLARINARITALKDRIIAGDLMPQEGNKTLTELQSLENDLLKP